MKLSDGQKSALAGAATGLVNGFFGTGGGMFLVPLLKRWIGLEEKQAMATAVAIVTPLCLLSAGIYWWRGAFDWGLAWPYLAGGLVGGYLGGRFFKKIPKLWLRRLFALLVLYAGVRSVLA